MANVFKLHVSINPTSFHVQRARILRPMCCNSESSSSTEKSTSKTGETKLLSSLDSYFSKLQNGSNFSKHNAVEIPTSSSTANNETNTTASRNLQGLNSLNAYFDKMQIPHKQDVPKESPAASQDDEEVLSFLRNLEQSFDRNFERSETKPKHTDFVPRNSSTCTSVIVGLNAAIFLFGLASPVQTPEMVEVPLPLLYGAKINALIADGQWWRLITPMFLHDGLIHIGLGAWALLSFGPAIESVYGPTGFCMIYLLGGLFGNLASFLHTPAPTVGGTGPLYALVAAWSVYIIQNRPSFSKEVQAGVTSDVVQKLLAMSALHFALTDALPADNWTHIGATLVGITFGLLATPKAAQMNVSLEDLDNKMVITGEAPDMQRLTLAFALCMAVFVTLYTFGNSPANEMFRVVIRNNDTNFL